MSPKPFGLAKLFGRESDCAELRRRASDYLEADISEEERQHILQHLEECRKCNSFLETFRATIAMLRVLPSRVIPQSLKDRLLQIPKATRRG